MASTKMLSNQILDLRVSYTTSEGRLQMSLRTFGTLVSGDEQVDQIDQSSLALAYKSDFPMVKVEKVTDNKVPISKVEKREHYPTDISTTAEWCGVERQHVNPMPRFEGIQNLQDPAKRDQSTTNVSKAAFRNLDQNHGPYEILGKFEKLLTRFKKYKKDTRALKLVVEGTPMAKSLREKFYYYAKKFNQLDTARINKVSLVCQANNIPLPGSVIKLKLLKEQAGHLPQAAMPKPLNWSQADPASMTELGLEWDHVIEKETFSISNDHQPILDSPVSLQTICLVPTPYLEPYQVYPDLAGTFGNDDNQTAHVGNYDDPASPNGLSYDFAGYDKQCDITEDPDKPGENETGYIDLVDDPTGSGLVSPNKDTVSVIGPTDDPHGLGNDFDDNHDDTPKSVQILAYSHTNFLECSLDTDHTDVQNNNSDVHTVDYENPDGNVDTASTTKGYEVNFQKDPGWSNDVLNSEAGDKNECIDFGHQETKVNIECGSLETCLKPDVDWPSEDLDYQGYPDIDAVHSPNDGLSDVHGLTDKPGGVLGHYDEWSDVISNSDRLSIPRELEIFTTYLLDLLMPTTFLLDLAMSVAYWLKNLEISLTFLPLNLMLSITLLPGLLLALAY